MAALIDDDEFSDTDEDFQFGLSCGACPEDEQPIDFRFPPSQPVSTSNVFSALDDDDDDEEIIMKAYWS